MYRHIHYFISWILSPLDFFWNWALKPFHHFGS